LADTFSTSSQERVQGSTPNLAQMFLMGSRPSVVGNRNPRWPTLIIWTSIVTFKSCRKCM